jgi:hypothetical protein
VSIRPPVSLPPILFDDVQPKSVYPLLKALAEKVPKPDAAFPKAPRLPEVENVPPSVTADTVRVPQLGVPKLAIATPLDLDAKEPVPRTEWMASVPDEDAFDKLFDEVTSRTQEELEALGIGRGGAEKSPDSATKGPDTARRARRRLEFADTITMPAASTWILDPNNGATESKLVVSPPLGPPPEQTSKAIRFGPPPEAPAPPKLKRGFAPPPVPLGQSKRPSVIMLAGIFGVVAIGVAIVVLTFSDKPTDQANSAASASASARMAALAASVKNALALSAKASASPLPPSASAEAPPLPYGQGYLTVEYPNDAMVYVSGRKLGQTNTRLQSRCGRYFVRVAKAGDGPYPEWLSAGQSVAIPCQNSIRVVISR